MLQRGQNPRHEESRYGTMKVSAGIVKHLSLESMEDCAELFTLNNVCETALTIIKDNEQLVEYFRKDNAHPLRTRSTKRLPGRKQH